MIEFTTGVLFALTAVSLFFLHHLWGKVEAMLHSLNEVVTVINQGSEIGDPVVGFHTNDDDDFDEDEDELKKARRGKR